MERLSIQELAAVLVTKSGLKKKDAERFATVMFDVVKEGLAADRQVKIKGLGTFKVIDIDSRESVDVNTGERVVIEGHDKITFTPDATMKELVNKAHQIPYGDTLIEFLDILRTAFAKHVHPFPTMAPCNDDNMKAVAGYDLEGILSDNVRIN